VATCGAPAGEATLEWRMATSPNLEQGVYVLIGLQPNLEWPRPAAFAQSTTTPEHRVDPLTGLPDRSTFEKCLAARCAPASDKWGPQFAVLFLDLDGFKEVNDRLGHRRGDAVLRCLAQRLAQAVRPSDLVARFGGDEFTLLLDNVHSVADAASVAQRFLATIEGAAVTGSSGGRISMSIGIALGRPGMPPDALIDAADRAMYQVKAVGGSGWALAEANGPA